jgi:hypothetical protein
LNSLECLAASNRSWYIFFAGGWGFRPWSEHNFLDWTDASRLALNRVTAKT